MGEAKSTTQKFQNRDFFETRKKYPEKIKISKIRSDNLKQPI